MNCFVLQQGSDLLIVDCGASFPEDDWGVDLIIPDFSWLVHRKDSIRGLFITHGHEDHIGAVVHLLRHLNTPIPIYAPPHAAALLAERLRRHELDPDLLMVVRPRERYQLGSFLVEPIAVAHSIVGATALCIETRAGRIIHTADFNLDDEQPAGHLTDEERFRELGRQGVDLLLSDSTNVHAKRRPLHEGDVGRELARLVKSAPFRVVVGMFSSNAHRLSSLIASARDTGRRMCLLGRSLNRQFEIAQRLGYLQVPSDLLISKEAALDLERDRVLVVAGGSQGEPASALRRIAQGNHPQLTLSEGDRVLLSARVIPGNERAVFSMVNDLMRSGVEVLTRSEEPGIHTSGHASRQELSRMLDWVRPRRFIPVHGTLMHLRAHAQLATESGVNDVLVVENGQTVSWGRERPLALLPRVDLSSVRVAVGGELLEGEVRRRRTDMGRTGSLFVSLVLDGRGELLGTPQVTSLGIPAVDRDRGAMDVLSNTVRRAMASKGKWKMQSLESMLARELRGAVLEMSGVRPVIVVHVLGPGMALE